MSKDAQKSFHALTPDCLLDALDSIGVRGDGRLLALNSYENRVYQVGVEEGAPMVVKFYRPGRWSDSSILEEHAFVRELADSEIPVVPAVPLDDGRTLHIFDGFRFAVFPRQGGRAPELDDSATREWLGRFIGRIHAVGASKAFCERPTLGIHSFGEEPLGYLLEHGFLPDDLLPAYRSVAQQALGGVQRCFDRAGSVPVIRLHGDCRIVIGCQHTIVSRNACH